MRHRKITACIVSNPPSRLNAAAVTSRTTSHAYTHGAQKELTMPDKQDDRKIHERFAAECFNAAWDLIETPSRSMDDDEQMLLRAMTSIWHWTQRPDCTQQNLAIGYWQVSRIHALLGRADEARRYGELSLAASSNEDVAPFALAYAFEALARAEAVAGNADARDGYITRARAVVDMMSDADTAKMVVDDLETIP
jgi:hypothetical protein